MLVLFRDKSYEYDGEGAVSKFSEFIIDKRFT